MMTLLSIPNINSGNDMISTQFIGIGGGGTDTITSLNIATSSIAAAKILIGDYATITSTTTDMTIDGSQPSNSWPNGLPYNDIITCDTSNTNVRSVIIGGAAADTITVTTTSIDGLVNICGDTCTISWTTANQYATRMTSCIDFATCGTVGNDIITINGVSLASSLTIGGGGADTVTAIGSVLSVVMGDNGNIVTSSVNSLSTVSDADGIAELEPIDVQSYFDRITNR